MGKLLQVDPICTKCGGELLMKHFFLNTLNKGKEEYEIIFECIECNCRDNLKFPLSWGVKNEDKDE